MPGQYSEIQVRAWVEEYIIGATLISDDKGAMFICPFHDDKHPSGFLWFESNRFECKACGAKGDIFSVLSAKLGKSQAAIKKLLHAQAAGVEDPTVISQELIEHYHQQLMANAKHLEILESKGINQATAEAFRLGADNTRITIPIYDSQGNARNIRKYKPNAKQHKTMNMKGYGKPRLFPYSIFEDTKKNEWLFIVEGELKALLLIQMELNAITTTGGVNAWNSDWLEEFRDRRVVILLDIDRGGRSASMKLCRRIFPIAHEVRNVLLPLDARKFPKGDVTDYVVDTGGTAQTLMELVKATDAWTPKQLQDDMITDDKVYPLHLALTSQSQWFGKFVKSEVVVSAKDTAPYLVPRKFTVECARDRGDPCTTCNMNAMPGGTPEFELNPKRAILLEMLNVSRDKLERILKRIAGIPARCEACALQMTDMLNVEELRLIPQLSIGEDEHEHVVRRAFYVGHGIETNVSYMMEARVVPEPNTQYATLIIYKAETAVDSISTFELDPEEKESLHIFQPTKWTVAGLEKRLDGIYDDLEANVTRIYKRRDLHIFVDLIYHSVLNFEFQDKLIKGWAEGLILGDSGQGKSEATKLLQQHYGLGEKVETKGATVAGLLGGAQETSKRWFITWGCIPLNDRRLVILEEIKGMDPAVIAKLTDMRSSGVAEIVKIESAKTRARCRLIWISNPRSDRQLLSYNFGIEAVKELMGSLEDVRRFDMAILLASGEVDAKWLNIDNAGRPVAVHEYTAALCRRLVLWAWSRKRADVIFDPAAVKAVLAHSSALGKKYASSIPLVEAADQRLKIARLAAAMATRTFSTDDGVTLRVRECHVDYIALYLERLYSAPAMGYDAYSALLQSEDTLHDEELLREEIIKMPHAKDTVRALLEATLFTVWDLEDLTGLERDQAKELMGILVRKNAIKRGRRGYMKTPPFIALLKSIQSRGKLTNETAYDKASQEDF